jgi:preprotein translocase subunit SecG
MDKLVLTLHILVSIFLIGTVLLQAGKGASIGASFGGGGGNQPIYGSSQGSFIGKLTAGAAIVFMFTSLTLAYFSADSSSIMTDLAPPSAEMLQEDAAVQVEVDKMLEDVAAKDK